MSGPLSSDDDKSNDRQPPPEARRDYSTRDQRPAKDDAEVSIPKQRRPK